MITRISTRDARYPTGSGQGSDAIHPSGRTGEVFGANPFSLPRAGEELMRTNPEEPFPSNESQVHASQ